MQPMSPYAKSKLKRHHDPRPSASSTPPKLSLFSFPPKHPDPPGFFTPPLQTPATVPFRWEEVPGRPRTMITTTTNTPAGSDHKPKSMRSLDLPPRLLTSTPSPTVTVLNNGPCDRTLSSTWSFRKLTGRADQGGSGIKKSVMESFKMNKIIRTSSPAEFGVRSSWRWSGGSAKVNKEEEESVDGGGSSFKIFDVSDDHDHYNEAATSVEEIIGKVKVKRKGSFFNKRSHFWIRVQESVQGSLKQVVVPWGRSGRAGQRSK
ncbi:hypothetical protein QQ045_009204 [Rhodiola kirilowii]